MRDFDAELETRLCRYAAIDSQSDMDSPAQPSTAIQHAMLDLMVEELRDIGAADVTKTGYGTVIATIPGNVPGPTIGFLAHVDTAPQFNATGVKPRVIRGYNGGAITFPDAPDLVLSPEDFPYLATKIGEDIVTASGTTLLGADDKAGIAIVMTAARHLLENPDLPRPTIRVAFTPDEEIGRGVDPRLPKDLGVDFAYTFDGGDAGRNGLRDLLGRFLRRHGHRRLDPSGRGEGQAGERHPPRLPHRRDVAAGDPDARDDRRPRGLHPCRRHEGQRRPDGRALHPARFRAGGAGGQGRPRPAGLRRHRRHRTAREGRGRDHAAVPQHALLARGRHDARGPRARGASEVGVEPVEAVIRGGTDGSRLTEMGVPCPNLFTGMQNVHGPLEFVSVQDMALATRLMLQIAARAGGQG
jgi:tripeptide aminopeptidase